MKKTAFVADAIEKPFGTLIVYAMDERAEELGVRRSDYLRRLVENDLRCAGAL